MAIPGEVRGSPWAVSSTVSSKSLREMEISLLKVRPPAAPMVLSSMLAGPFPDGAASLPEPQSLSCHLFLKLFLGPGLCVLRRGESAVYLLRWRGQNGSAPGGAIPSVLKGDSPGFPQELPQGAPEQTEWPLKGALEQPAARAHDGAPGGSCEQAQGASWSSG